MHGRGTHLALPLSRAEAPTCVFSIVRAITKRLVSFCLNLQIETGTMSVLQFSDVVRTWQTKVSEHKSFQNSICQDELVTDLDRLGRAVTLL